MITLKDKTKILIFLAIFIIGLIFSILITTSLTDICDPGKGCDIVNHSKYGETLGIKNSTTGTYVFSVLILLSLSELIKKSKIKTKLIKYSIIAGSLIALYFIYLQAFVINAWCKYCLIIDISLILGLIILFLPNKK